MADGIVSKTKFREDIDIELSKLDAFNEREDRRIKLDKDTLDRLLFDYYVDKDGKIFKRVGFFSDNLDKLDLSEVSFEDVSFNGDNYEFPGNSDSYQVSFQFTNAVIDFSKSYEYKRDKKVIVSRFNFTGTDLSNNNWNKLTEKNCGFIKFCNLCNTGTKLSYKDKNGAILPVYLKIFFTNLAHLDLSDVRIDVVNQRTLDTEISFDSCSLSNSKARLEYYGREDEIRTALEKGNVSSKFDGLFKTSKELESIAKFRYLSEHSSTIDKPNTTTYNEKDLNIVKTFISSQIKKIKSERTAY